MADCPTRFTIARLRAEDLKADQARATREHIDGCAGCRRILAEIDGNAAAYEADADQHLSRLMDRIEREQTPADVVPIRARHKSRVTRVAIGVGGLALAAMLALVLVPVISGQGRDDDQTDIRFKGALAVEIVAKRGSEQFRVTDGLELRCGDAIRFVVTTGSAGWLSVFSVDSTGRLSPFYPDSEPADAPAPYRIERPGRHELPGSIILDDTAGHEDIVVAFSRERFDRGSAHRSVAAAGDVDQAREALGPELELEIVRVVKTLP
jgi:hypothetical protein